ncbi:nucleotidyl transferase AbiEii/AbiGii toxin family protein [Nocardiopsis ganjiahuensis]|uniref:nucleotidyl transferase AbiEii/AbiGii toxin family protein n=1 Tax=Nocardiopsis ganjiahuensis TaxID=239984 RepID=UPI00034570E8|nr:nucleotidyl transferase AbiEii/AbiGii toxin family protein [Nocardiopsis ganjiahuensis]
MEFAGDFETHLTLRADSDADVASAAAWAAEQGLKFTHIQLDRGDAPSQPMVTYHGHGTLTGQRAIANRWRARLAGAGFEVVREKHEVAHTNADVPGTPEEARALGPGYYFETHLKLLLPADADLDGLARLVGPHRARLSRNARRTREDGRQERFVTQRCSGVDRNVAYELHSSLREVLNGQGLPRSFSGEENGVIDTEREFVVYDSALALDAGWLDDAPVTDPVEARRRWYDPTYPATFLPVTAGPHATQEKVFDPAMKQFDHAFRPAEPVFTDPGLAERWWAANRSAMEHVLRAVSTTEWADSLVLRGSTTMPLWVGERARRPRDLDFVALPETRSAEHHDSVRMLDDLVSAVGALEPPAGLVFDTAGTRGESIWTYERASGRRLVIPWQHTEGPHEVLPPGTVQVDVVFQEPLPEPPLAATVGDIPVLIAGPELSLAWKVQWLVTDTYPQGKDLYDAVLLAESHPLPHDLLMRVLRPEMDAEADEMNERYLSDGEGHLRCDYDLIQGWEHFVRDCPWVEGGPGEWIDRFEAALAPTFRELRDGPHN